MISARDLGWMAGIIDLRGRIQYKNNRSRRTRQITLGVESKEFAVIRELSRLTGTKPEMREQAPLKDWMRRGCIEHCPEQHIHNVSEYSLPQMAKWTVTGASMVVILDTLAPFLRVDRGYAEAVAEIKDHIVLVGQGSSQVLQGLRRLQLLEWPIPAEFEHALTTSQPIQEAA